MWGRIAAGVTSALVVGYVGRKAYVANRTRREENEALKKDNEDLKAKVSDLADRVALAEENAATKEELTNVETRLTEAVAKAISSTSRSIEEIRAQQEGIEKAAMSLIETINATTLMFVKQTVDPAVPTAPAKETAPETVTATETAAEPAAETAPANQDTEIESAPAKPRKRRQPLPTVAVADVACAAIEAAVA